MYLLRKRYPLAFFERDKKDVEENKHPNIRSLSNYQLGFPVVRLVAMTAVRGETNNNNNISMYFDRIKLFSRFTNLVPTLIAIYFIFQLDIWLNDNFRVVK